jgi:peptidoglycan/xylan/chitin deacetylase (PgdA/CDA1 family)
MLGSIPFGVPVTQCTRPGTIALTYDDGPSEYTSELLAILERADAKATFFVSRIVNGRGEIDIKNQWIQDIRRMEARSHQIGSHGWSHFNLDTLSSEQRRDEMYKNERAIANILGKYPTYMRAPYVLCQKDCLKDMKDLGYKVIQWSVDSRDTEFPNDMVAVKKAVDAGFAEAGDSGGILLIQHDTLVESAVDLTEYVLEKVTAKGWRAVTVAECLGESLKDAYREKKPVEGPIAGPAA